MIVNKHGDTLKIGMSVYVTTTGQAGYIHAVQVFSSGGIPSVTVSFEGDMAFGAQEFPPDMVRPFDALAAATAKVEYARTVFEGAQAFYAVAQKELEVARANDTTATSQASLP